MPLLTSYKVDTSRLSTYDKIVVHIVQLEIIIIITITDKYVYASTIIRVIGMHYFTVKRFLMKLFESVNMELINECRIMFRV
jgi:hypothetical protein